MERAIHFPNLGIHLGNVGDVLTVGDYQITFYGILIALGILIATAYMLVWVRRSGQDVNHYLNLVIVSGITALIGARGCYLLFYTDLVREDPSVIWKVWEGGFSLYGAIFGGMVGGLIVSAICHVPFLKMADTACVEVLIVQIAGRIGNFFNRECFGEYTDNLFCMQIPVSAVRPAEITDLMRENLVTLDAVEYIQVHPTFLYESLWCLLLFFFLLWYRQKKRFEGEIFLVYLLGYSLGRVWIEELRTDKLMIPALNRSFSQITAAVLIIICLLFILGGRNIAGKRQEAAKRQKEALYREQEKAGENQEEKTEKDFFETSEPEENLDVDQVLEEQDKIDV